MTRAQILALLRTKYLNLGLSEEALNELVDIAIERAGDNATGEQIQTAIDGVEKLAKVIQSVADKARAQAKKDKDKEDKDKKEENPTPTPTSTPTPADVPDYVKTIMEELKGVKESLAKAEQGKTAKSRRDAYVEAMKGIPKEQQEIYLENFDRANFKDDADFDSYLEKSKGTFTKLAEAEVARSAGEFGSRLFSPSGEGDAPSAAVKMHVEGIKARESGKGSASDKGKSLFGEE